MRPEAQRHLRELRELQETEAYLERVRANPSLVSGDRQLEAFVRLAEKVVAFERKRLGIDV